MLRRNYPLSDPEPLIERVYSYAAYRLGPGPDAEDVTSETIERGLRYVQSYDSQAGSVQAWLLGIARHVINDHLARAGRQARLRVEPAGNGDEMASAAIERLALRDAIASLTLDERDLLALRYGADLTAREIARITGARSNAVEVALHRTLAKLRQIIDALEQTHERA
jgi:RNA polymerase sigma factor (sigma-70 family)